MGGLAHFDNVWDCDKCGKQFTDEDDFIYCPFCGDVLKNNWYQRDVQFIEKFFNESRMSICENCGEEFDKEFNFCPLCSKELKKEGISFNIDDDNSITAEWNDNEVLVFDKEMFLSSPHFSRSALVNSFEFKESLDDKTLKMGLHPS